MDPDPAVPLLYRFLNTNPAAIRHGLRRKKCDRWAEAFDDWLAQREQERGKHERIRSRSIWKKFLQSCPKWPFDVRRQDIQSFVETLTARDYAVHTVRGYLFALKSFYIFCHARDPHPSGSLFPKDVFPATPGYSRSNRMSRDQVSSLLRCVDRHDSLYGKRDYAMLLLALSAGLRLHELRALRFEHLRCTDADDPLCWTIIRNHRDRCWEQDLPPEAALALRDWLLAVERLPPPPACASDFVFPPAGLAAGLLPSDRYFLWTKSISSVQSFFILKQYARLAGLPWLTWHTIHHTAVWLRVEAGENPEQMVSLLGASTSKNIRDYLGRLYRLTHLPPQQPGARPAPLRRKPRAGLIGAAYGYKHGAFENNRLKSLPAAEALVHLRARLMVLSVLEKHAETEDERLDLLQRMGFTAARILKLKQY